MLVNGIHLASISNSILFASNPPAYPVSERLLPMTRWQGMRMLMPLAPMAHATALTASGWPMLELFACNSL